MPTDLGRDLESLLPAHLTREIPTRTVAVPSNGTAYFLLNGFEEIGETAIRLPTGTHDVRVGALVIRTHEPIDGVALNVVQVGTVGSKGLVWAVDALPAKASDLARCIEAEWWRAQQLGDEYDRLLREHPEWNVEQDEAIFDGGGFGPTVTAELNRRNAESVALRQLAYLSPRAG